MLPGMPQFFEIKSEVIRYNGTVATDCTEYLLWVRTQNHISSDSIKYGNSLGIDELQLVIPILEKGSNDSSVSRYQHLKIEWRSSWDDSCKLHFQGNHSGEQFFFFTNE